MPGERTDKKQTTPAQENVAPTEGKPPASPKENFSPVDRFAHVLDASRHITAALSREAVFEAVRSSGLSLLQAEQCAIIELASLHQSAEQRALEREYELALFRRALFSGQPVLAERPDRAVLAAPLLVHGQVEAFIYASRPRPFGEEDERLASFICTLGSAALENAEGVRAIEARVEERTRELSAALRELKAAQSRLVHQGRMASLGQLVAAVAHEIANPLNFTLGGAATLSRRHDALTSALEAWAARNGEDPDVSAALRQLRASRQSLELILSGNKRIKEVIEALRTYVRGGIVAAEPADLLRGIESTLALVRPQLKSQGILVVRALEPLPQVTCRAGELNQVFMNLILNACQAMPDGGELRISTREVAGGVEISFSDTGPGVPKELREQIFEPFFTTREAGEGTGLGLSISHEIISRHGGRLELSDHGPGATFVIFLPLQTLEGDLPVD